MRASGGSIEEFPYQPFRFNAGPLGLVDNVITATLRAEVIEQRPVRHEPPVFPADPLHRFPKTVVYRSVIVESEPEMSVHDARPAFCFKLVLSFFGQQRCKAGTGRTFRRRIPLPNEWTFRVEVR